MPTGAGKSFINKFDALQLGGLTLVILPLIALMKDQVDALNRCGIPAAFINSAISPSVQRAARETARVDENKSGKPSRRAQTAKFILMSTYPD